MSEWFSSILDASARSQSRLLLLRERRTWRELNDPDESTVAAATYRCHTLQSGGGGWLQLSGSARVSSVENASAGAPLGDDPKATIALFETAVREHSRRLLAVARGIVGNRTSPEDVVQQALTNLYQHRQRYDWHEPGGLMRRAVVNEALRVLRQPRLASIIDELPPASASQLEPADEMVDRETVQRVRQAIDRLPEHFRAALVLCEYESMSYVQIAQTLGASVPQVKTWIHRARRQMGEMLKEFMASPPKGPRKKSPTAPSPSHEAEVT